MKVLICGGRDFDDWDFFYAVIDPLLPRLTTIISGMARGADHMACVYGADNFIRVEEYPADWARFGKSAGYLRNKQMLEEGKPDLVVAFPGGRGTANMIAIAMKAGVKVIDAKYLTVSDASNEYQL